MLKKAGIVLAASAAGLLSISPLAFAGDYQGGHDSHRGGGHDCGCDDGGGHRGGDHDGDHGGDHGGRDHGGRDRGVRDSGGRGSLINVSNIGVQVPVQACNNSILSGVLGILSVGQRNNDSHNGQCGQSNSGH